MLFCVLLLLANRGGGQDRFPGLDMPSGLPPGDPLLPHHQHRSIEHVGSATNGWTMITSGLSRETIIYSVGLGTDISFDQAIIEKYDLNVWGFDNTPAHMGWWPGVQSKFSAKMKSNFHHLEGCSDGKLGPRKVP